MDDGDSKNNKQIKRQKQSPNALQRHGIDVGSFLQSYCGVFFWAIYLLYEAIK